MFIIQMKHTDGCWIAEAEGLGGPDATFATKSEAYAAIAALQALGQEWTEAEYRIQEVLETA